MPRVSVIIPTYNCARYIEQTIKSVFFQTFKDYEVIIVDDGSTDDTCVRIDPWAEKIIYIYQSNRGPSAARNLAVSLANGQFLAYIDADDQWLPHKLERQVAYLEAYPECGLVHGDVTVIDEAGQILHQCFNDEKKLPILKGNCVHELLRRSCIHMPSVMERRSCFDEVGGFDERIRYGEDYLHWLKITLFGHLLGYIEKPLALYRWRNGSLSQVNSDFVDAKSIEMSESMLTVYNTLQKENKTNSFLDSESESIVYKQIANLQLDLAYQYRTFGRNDLARHKAVKLIRSSPTALQPYIEFLKACIPLSTFGVLKRVAGEVKLIR